MIGQNTYNTLEINILRAAAKGNEATFVKLLEQFKQINHANSDDPEEQHYYKIKLIHLLHDFGHSLLAGMINASARMTQEQSVKIVKHILDELESAGVHPNVLNCMNMLDINLLYDHQGIFNRQKMNELTNPGGPPQSWEGYYPPDRLDAWIGGCYVDAAAELVDHTFVMYCSHKNQIREALCNGNTQEARRLSKAYNLDLELIYEPHFMRALFDPAFATSEFASLAPTVDRERFVVDLLEHNEIGVSQIFQNNLPVPAVPPPARLIGTRSMDLINAFLQLSGTAPGAMDGLDFDTLRESIRQVLGSCETQAHKELMASDIFKILTVAHGGPNSMPWLLPNPAGTGPHRLPENKHAELEAILKDLLEQGAKIPFPAPTMPGANLFCLSTLNTLLQHGMEDLIEQPAFIKQWNDRKGPAGILATCEFDILDCISCLNAQALDLVCRTIEPKRSYLQLNEPSAFNTNDEFMRLCNNAVMNVPNPPLDLSILNEPENAANKAHFEKHLAVAGIMLKYNLVKDRDLIKPGVHIPHMALGFNNPKTNQPYELYDFIMDNPQLKAGWLRQVRDQELMDTYTITKALVQERKRMESKPSSPKMTDLERKEHLQAKETELKSHLEKLNRVANMDEPEQLAQSIAALQKDVQALILARVTQGEDIPMDHKQVTAAKLHQIATSAVEKGEHEATSGKKEGKSPGRK